MKMQSKKITEEQLILKDKSQYLFCIKRVEITNSLGAEMVNLFKYSISRNSS